MVRRLLLPRLFVALAMSASLPAAAEIVTVRIDAEVAGFFISPGVVALNSEFQLGEPLVAIFTYDEQLLVDTRPEADRGIFNGALLDILVVLPESATRWNAAEISSGTGQITTFNDVVSGDSLTDQWGAEWSDTPAGTTIGDFEPVSVKVGAVQFIDAALGVLPPMLPSDLPPTETPIFDERGGDLRVVLEDPEGTVGMVGILFTGTASTRLTERDLVPSSGDGLLTFDSTTNLEWLDLTETTGLSFDQVSGGAGGFIGSQGFRFASLEEVEDLYLAAGVIDFGIEQEFINTPAANLLLDLMGCTEICSETARGAAGLTSTTFQPGTHALPFFQLNEDFGARFLAGENGVADSSSEAFRGSYLVRATPEPSSTAAAAAAMIALALVGSKRRAPSSSSTSHPAR